MKIGLLVNEGEAPVKNIGDYIQSLVQWKMWGKYDCYIEREKIHEFHSNETVKVIMNGWFMRHPLNFPPSEDIDPLFISFHLTPKIEKEFFTEKTIDYLKSHEPIGCRDYGTVRMMESHGVKAYFSGCLTLCLGEYYNLLKSDRVCFVDPYYEYGAGAKGIFSHLKALYYIIKHFRKVSKFIDDFSPEFYGVLQKISPKLNKWAMASSFYETYRNYFSDDVFKNAVYINHQISQSEYPTNDDKMKLADKLMHMYGSAGMVVTSRIHCALPCVGVETPVIFVTSEDIEDGSLRSGGRLDGIIELINVLKWTPKGLHPVSERLKKIKKIRSVSDARLVGNPTKYIPLKRMMMNIAHNFQLK